MLYHARGGPSGLMTGGFTPSGGAVHSISWRQFSGHCGCIYGGAAGGAKAKRQDMGSM